jgi:hypothetical protein
MNQVKGFPPLGGPVNFGGCEAGMPEETATSAAGPIGSADLSSKAATQSRPSVGAGWAAYRPDTHEVRYIGTGTEPETESWIRAIADGVSVTGLPVPDEQMCIWEDEGGYVAPIPFAKRFDDLTNSQFGWTSVPVAKRPELCDVLGGPKLQEWLVIAEDEDPSDSWDSRVHVQLLNLYCFGLPGMDCALDPNWRFEEIEVDTCLRLEHVRAAELGRPLRLKEAAKIAFELETSLELLHPGLPVQGRRIFWTSVEVARHIVDTCRGRVVAEALLRRIGSYVHELEAASSVEMPAGNRDREASISDIAPAVSTQSQTTSDDAPRRNAADGARQQSEAPAVVTTDPPTTAVALTDEPVDAGVADLVGQSGSNSSAPVTDHEQRVRAVEQTYGRGYDHPYTAFYKPLGIKNHEFVAWRKQDNKRYGRVKRLRLNSAADKLISGRSNIPTKLQH